MEAAPALDQGSGTSGDMAGVPSHATGRAVFWSKSFLSIVPDVVTPAGPVSSSLVDPNASTSAIIESACREKGMPSAG